jgi:hypothetical protein
MKKILFCLMILASTVLAAQKKGKVFFYVQGGYMSAGYMKALKEKVPAAVEEHDHHKCIVLNSGILITLTDRWRAGPVFTYDHYGTKHRSVEYSNLSYMARCERIFLETKNYSIYSGLALGIRKTRKFINEVEVEKKVSAGYQFYLAGIDLKMKNWMLDVNAGCGVSGILSAGIKYRFD